MKKEIFTALLTIVAAIVSAAFKHSSDTSVYSLHAFIFTGLLALIYIYLLVRRKNNIDLNMHPFWSRMNYYINSKMPNMHFKNELRRKLMIKAMTIKFEVAVNQLRNFVNRKDFDDIAAVCLINNIILEYKTKWRAEGIPEIFIYKFHNYHNKKVASIVDYLEFICTSNFYENDIDKKVAILDGMLHVFQWTVIDLERADAAMNGTLDGELAKLRRDGKF